MKKDLCKYILIIFFFEQKIENGSPYLVYETEIVQNNLKPQFKEFEINLGKLASGDIHAPVIVELWDGDYDGKGKHLQMGEF